jgi:hypothetical protein
MAAERVFRSDNRGRNWEEISGDLSRNEDRNQFKVMDKYWSIDAVAKDVSTSLWGLIVSLSESKVKKDLLYAGTDDGVIAITEDGGKNWTRITTFPGIPEYTYVSDILPDKFDENVVYATFNNMLRDDFKPYILKSSDKGKTWTPITNKLPANGTIHTIEQDNVNPNLLFAGSEFGFYFSIDGGNEWIEFKTGLPTIAIRDIAIQEREVDLVIGTFGRGIYILDDYSPLRNFKKEMLDKEAVIFPIKDSKMYVQSNGFDNQGSTYFKSPNPEFGATFTYFVKDVPKTAKAMRQEKEKDLFKKGEPIQQPSIADLDAESKEIKPYLIFTITDESNNVVKRLYKSAAKGINRITWNFAYESISPVTVTKYDPIGPAGGRRGGGGIQAMPGKYKLSMSLYAKGETRELAGPEPFVCKPLGLATFSTNDEKAKYDWINNASDFSRSIYGTISYTSELVNKVNAVMQAIHQTPGASVGLIKEAERINSELDKIMFIFNGPEAKASEEELPPMQLPLSKRLNEMASATYGISGDITIAAKEQLEILKSEFPPVLERVKQAGRDLQDLDKQLDAAKAPWTPGRVPVL